MIGVLIVSILLVRDAVTVLGLLAAGPWDKEVCELARICSPVHVAHNTANVVAEVKVRERKQKLKVQVGYAVQVHHQALAIMFDAQ